VFDSGMGGLTVLRELTKKLPGEQFVYFGDTARAPYGNRSAQEICRFAVEIGGFLLERDCKMLIFACHTATVLGMAALTSITAKPVLGMVEAALAETLGDPAEDADPGADEAIWPVGMIATQGTAESGDYQRFFAQRAPGKPFYMQACPDFVPLVEKGVLVGPDVERAAEKHLSPLRERGIRTLVLGCTHYPFLVRPISAYFGAGVRLADPAHKLALLAEQELAKRDLLADVRGKAPKAPEYWCSGNPGRFNACGAILLGHALGQVRMHVF